MSERIITEQEIKRFSVTVQLKPTEQCKPHKEET